jgi:uncharacterized protein (DUF2147 family)
MWILLFIPLALAQIEGRWLSEDKDGEVLIYREGDRWFGRLIRIKLTPEADPKVVGTVIVKDMQKVGDEWSGGTVYDPKSGNTYKAKMWRDGKNLKLRGYIGISLFGRSSQWTPLKDGEIGIQGESMTEVLMKKP